MESRRERQTGALNATENLSRKRAAPWLNHVPLSSFGSHATVKQWTWSTFGLSEDCLNPIPARNPINLKGKMGYTPSRPMVDGGDSIWGSDPVNIIFFRKAEFQDVKRLVFGALKAQFKCLRKYLVKWDTCEDLRWFHHVLLKCVVIIFRRSWGRTLPIPSEIERFEGLCLTKLISLGNLGCVCRTILPSFRHTTIEDDWLSQIELEPDVSLVGSVTDLINEFVGYKAIGTKLNLATMSQVTFLENDMTAYQRASTGNLGQGAYRYPSGRPPGLDDIILMSIRFCGDSRFNLVRPLYSNLKLERAPCPPTSYGYRRKRNQLLTIKVASIKLSLDLVGSSV